MSNNVFRSSPTAFTIAVWAKRDPSQSDRQAIVSLDYDWNYQSDYTNDNEQSGISLVFDVWSSGFDAALNGYRPFGSRSIEVGKTGLKETEWHFYMITAENDGNLILYVDGVEEDRASLNGKTLHFDGTDIDWIGNSRAGGNDPRYHSYDPNERDRGWFFRGCIDDVRIYNRALTAGEAEQLFGMEPDDDGDTSGADDDGDDGADSDVDSTGVTDFVTRFYHECLERDPDLQGLNGWVNGLLNGWVTGGEMAKSFMLSPEFESFQTSDYTFLTILYRAFFDRDPDAVGFEGWVSALRTGTSRSKVIDGFIFSNEFEMLCRKYGIIPYALDLVEAFVARFYNMCLNRDPDQEGLNGWVNGLKNDWVTGGELARGFLLSPEFKNRQTADIVFLEILYRTFFDREPDGVGLEGWLSALGGGMSRGEVLEGFIHSSEFSALCASYGITAVRKDTGGGVIGVPSDDVDEVVLDERFDSNPGWYVTKPEYFQWWYLAGEGSFRFETQCVVWPSPGSIDYPGDDPGYFAFSPAFENISNRSFVFQFDILPTISKWGRYPAVGVCSEGDIEPWRSGAFRISQHWSDSVRQKFQLSIVLPDGSRKSYASPKYTNTNWYTHHVVYDADQRTMTWTVTEKSAGRTFFSHTENGIQFLDFNQVFAGFGPLQRCYGSGLTETYIDNVKLRLGGYDGVRYLVKAVARQRYDSDGRGRN